LPVLLYHCHTRLLRLLIRTACWNLRAASFSLYLRAQTVTLLLPAHSRHGYAYITISRNLAGFPGRRRAHNHLAWLLTVHLSPRTPSARATCVASLPPLFVQPFYLVLPLPFISLSFARYSTFLWLRASRPEQFSPPRPFSAVFVRCSWLPRKTFMYRGLRLDIAARCTCYSPSRMHLALLFTTVGIASPHRLPTYLMPCRNNCRANL